MAEAQAQIYKTNKEKIKEYNKEYGKTYRLANKEKFNEKFICDVCGGKTTRSNISKHLKTTKHLKFVESQNKCSFRDELCKSESVRAPSTE